MKVHKKITAIHISSSVEWEAVKSLLNVEQVSSTPYGELFYHTFDYWESTALFYYSGYSKSKAAGCVQHIIDRYSPERVIVAGTSGGISNRLDICDVVIGTQTWMYDCIDRLGIQTELFASEFRTILNVEMFKHQQLPERTFFGIIATADQDVDQTVRGILEPHNILVADWESAAVAIVCDLCKIPLTVFRGVTDIPTNDLSRVDQTKDYHQNGPKVMKRIIEEYLPLLKI